MRFGNSSSSIVYITQTPSHTNTSSHKLLDNLGNLCSKPSGVSRPNLHQYCCGIFLASSAALATTNQPDCTLMSSSQPYLYAWFDVSSSSSRSLTDDDDHMMVMRWCLFPPSALPLFPPHQLAIVPTYLPTYDAIIRLALVFLLLIS